MVGTWKAHPKSEEKDPAPPASPEVYVAEVALCANNKRRKLGDRAHSDVDCAKMYSELETVCSDPPDFLKGDWQNSSDSDNALHIDETVCSCETSLSGGPQETYVDENASHLDSTENTSLDKQPSADAVNVEKLSSETNEGHLTEKTSATLEGSGNHRIQLMNAEPTKENRVIALQFCRNVLAKVSAAKGSADSNLRSISDCVYFYIMQQARALKLLSTKLNLKLSLTNNNEGCHEVIETIVGFWDDERLELRDLARACFGVLHLGGELISSD